MSFSRLRVSFVGSVIPQPKASAAGLHTMGLLKSLRKEEAKVTFFTPNKFDESQSSILREIGIEKSIHCLPNDPIFDAHLMEANPDIIFFDRFITEEQFGFRVRNQLPNCIRVVDSQDFHSLRHVRENAILKEKHVSEVVKTLPAIRSTFGTDSDTKNTEELMRELSSFHRSDHVLLVSSFEKEILEKVYGISKEKLSIASFYYDPLKLKFNQTNSPSFSDRRHFCMIGNFKHKPNVDQLRWVVKYIWPTIHNRVPGAKLHIYGALQDGRITELNNSKLNVVVKGYTDNQYDTLSQYRVNLAPLRFGAGIKGKISDGMFVGTPCVTTEIGSEGMMIPGSDLWGGFIASAPHDKDLIQQIIDRSVELYSNSEVWNQKSKDGYALVDQLFNEKKNGDEFIETVKRMFNRKESTRNKNTIGEILWHNSMRATEHMSKFIEKKNELNLLKSSLGGHK